MKKSVIALISVSSVLLTGLTGTLIGIAVWANKPRGIRVPLDISRH